MAQGLARSLAPQMADNGKRIKRKKTKNDKNLESLHGDHPRRDGGAQVLGSKRSERNIFPLLDVPRRPVVHQDHSEDVFVGLLSSDGVAHGGAVAPNEESQSGDMGQTWGVQCQPACFINIYFTTDILL